MELKISNFYLTILHYACLSGDLNIVKFIIELNIIDINSEDIYIFENFNNVHL